MQNTGMKKCPFCAEMIQTEAVKCRWCGSIVSATGKVLLGEMLHNSWRRVNEGKKIAGVCTGLTRQLGMPKLLLPLRLVFIFGAMFYGLGAVLYLGLLILMPRPTDEPAVWVDTCSPQVLSRR